MKVVRLSAIRTGLFNPQGRSVVLISVRGWVDSKATMRPEGLNHWKIPKTRSGFFVCILLYSIPTISVFVFLLIVLHYAFFCFYLQHTTQTFMPPAGFEPATPASYKSQTLAVDHSATGIGGIEPATFRLVAQCLNQLRHRTSYIFLTGFSFLVCVQKQNIWK